MEVIKFQSAKVTCWVIQDRRDMRVDRQTDITDADRNTPPTYGRGEVTSDDGSGVLTVATDSWSAVISDFRWRRSRPQNWIRSAQHTDDRRM